MEYLIVSFLAGVLTILAPCVLPLLPVIVGGTASHTGEKNKYTPLIVTASLTVSVVLFTLLIRGSTVLIGVDQQVWQVISGSLVLGLGIFALFPDIWEKITIKTGFSTESNKLLASAATKKGILKPILIGSALGPVFVSCSPTYGFILATVLPQSFFEGFINILAYGLGLAVVMLILSYAGQQLIHKLGWATDPKGWFRRGLGLLFILVGVGIITGWDKNIEAWIIDQGWYDPVSDIENNLRD